MSDNETTTPVSTESGSNDQQTQVLIMAVAGLFTSFVGPLILYFVWKDKNPLVQRAGSKIVNSHITLWLMFIGAMIVAAILGIIIGFLNLIVMLAAVLFYLYVCVMLIIKANKKEYDQLKVPFFTLNLLK